MSVAGRDTKPRLKKKKVDKVVERHFWEGFQEGLSSYGGEGIALEYSSTSGLYDYNVVRHIAGRAGYALAQKVLAEHVARLDADARGGPRPRLGRPFKYEIPASVFAECYAEGRIG